MATQYGEVGLQTAAGTQKIPLWKKDDVATPILSCATPSGPAAIAMKDPSGAQWPQLKCNTPNGILAASNDPLLVCDDFEDADFDEYTTFPSDIWEASTAWTSHGNYSLHMLGEDVNGNDTPHGAVSPDGNGLPHYPTAGEGDVVADFYLADGSERYDFRFATHRSTDAEDSYAVILDGRPNKTRAALLWVRSSNPTVIYQQKNYNPPSGTNIEVRVQNWNASSGEWDCVVDDGSSTVNLSTRNSSKNTPYTDGGLGWHCSGGANGYADYARVEP